MSGIYYSIGSPIVRIDNPTCVFDESKSACSFQRSLLSIAAGDESHIDSLNPITSTSKDDQLSA